MLVGRILFVRAAALYMTLVRNLGGGGVNAQNCVDEARFGFGRGELEKKDVESEALEECADVGDKGDSVIKRDDLVEVGGAYQVLDDLAGDPHEPAGGCTTALWHG